MFTHVKLCDWTALTFGSEDRPDGQQAHTAPATQARAQAQAAGAGADSGDCKPGLTSAQAEGAQTQGHCCSQVVCRVTVSDELSQTPTASSRAVDEKEEGFSVQPAVQSRYLGAAVPAPGPYDRSVMGHLVQSRRMLCSCDARTSWQEYVAGILPE